MENSREIRKPDDSAKWCKNNVRNWPRLVYEDLVDYLINKKAYDGKEMRAFRALYGKNYVESGWLGDVFDCQVDTGVCYLKSVVSPSQPGVGRKDYETWAAVNKADSTIITGNCTCPAGAGRTCSHISALLYAVVMAYEHGTAGESCTDKPRTWGTQSCSQVMNAHEPFTELINDNRKLKNESDDNVLKPQQFLDHKDIVDFVNHSSMKPLWECKGTILNKILTAPERIIPEKQQLKHGQHDLPTDRPLIPECKPCKEFYQKYVDVGERKAAAISGNTSGQNNMIWMDSRKVRITASKVHSLPKTARADPNKYVTSHIYQRFKGCAATRHGKNYEAVARDWFEKETGLKVKKSGIVVRDDEMLLAASPDGIIDDKTIVEIKCPTKSLQDYIKSGKYDVVLDDNGKTVLNPKGKNGYYTQVQITMYCTRTSMCKFVVWTSEPDGQAIIDVPFDSDFVNGILPRIRKFYHKHLLVRLADEYHFGRLELSQGYKKLCS